MPDSTLIRAARDLRELIESEADQIEATCTITKHVAKSAVLFAWEASGSAGMRNPNRLQRCFRDIHIGAGHQVFDDRGYREAAKAALGLEPLPF